MKIYTHPFADVWYGQSDLTNELDSYRPENTSEDLEKLCEYFYKNEKNRKNLEEKMMEAAEQFIHNVIDELFPIE